MSGNLTTGRNAKIFVDASAAGTMALGTTAGGTSVLTQLNGRNQWTVDWTPTFVDVTSFGDTSQTNVPGLPGGGADLSGNWDFAGTLIKNILPPGASTERSIMIFPDATNYGTVFWSGKGYFGMKTGGGITSAVSMDLHFEPGPTGLALYP